MPAAYPPRGSVGELVDWLAFFRREAHRLSEFPQMLVQQAVNLPDDRPEALAARARIREGRVAGPWFRWDNKPAIQGGAVLTLVCPGRVTACAFALDDACIVAWYLDPSDRMAPARRIAWDAVTGSALSDQVAGIPSEADAPMDPHNAFASMTPPREVPHGVWFVAQSADGRRIAAGISGGFSAPDSVTVWDAETGDACATFAGHASAISCCALAHDGRWLISGSDDRTVRLWDVLVDEPVSGPADGIRGCVFSPDYRQIVSSTQFEGFAFFDGETGIETRHFEEGEAVGTRPLAWSPDGRRVAFGDRYAITLIDPDAPSDPDADVDPVRFGRHIWDIHGARFLPEGRTVVSVGGEWNEGDVKVWDAVTGEETTRIDPACHRIHGCACSPDGSLLFTGSRDGTGTLWHLPSGKRLREFPHPVKGITCCAFSPDGRRITTGASDGVVRVWHARSGAMESAVAVGAAAILACDYSADGQWLFSLGYGARLTCWRVADGRRIAMFECDQAPRAMAVAAAGRRIAMSGLAGRLWVLSLMADAHPVITTPAALFRFVPNARDPELTAPCFACGARVPVPPDVIAVIAECRGLFTSGTESSYLDLPDAAWDDARLAGECPHCTHALRFTPFAAVAG